MSTATPMRLPVSLFLNTLREAYPSESLRGREIPKTEVVALFQHDDTAPRTDYILQCWRDEVKETHGIVSISRKGVIRFLTYEEQHANAMRKEWSGARALNESELRMKPTLAQGMLSEELESQGHQLIERTGKALKSLMYERSQARIARSRPRLLA